MTNKEISSQNKLKNNKPYVYEKMSQFTERVAKGISNAIIQFQYDYKCNFKCDHCSVKKFQGKSKKRKFNIDDVKELSKQADEYGLANFVITGGEPLIFKDLEDIVKAINPDKFYIGMDTNGYLLTKDKVKFLKSIGIDKVQISIDSLNKKEHDEFRKQEGSCFKAIKGALYSVNEGLDIIIQTVVTKQRLRSEEFIDFIEFFNKTNMPVFVTFAKPVGSWEGNFDVLCDYEDMEYFKELESKYNVFSHLTPAYNINYGCIAVKRILSVTQYGDVMPCPYIHTSLGNVFEESLESIINKGLSIKYFGDYYDKCFIACDREFIDKYVVENIYNKELPVYYKDVFKDKGDYI
jgi:MoaA/NifB/PqqE/SkfB family radical SAM enzyme